MKDIEVLMKAVEQQTGLLGSNIIQHESNVIHFMATKKDQSEGQFILEKVNGQWTLWENKIGSQGQWIFEDLIPGTSNDELDFNSLCETLPPEEDDNHEEVQTI